MFYLKSVFVILSVALISQNIFAQKTVKRTPQRTSTRRTNSASKAQSNGTNDVKVYSRVINGIVKIVADCGRGLSSQGSGFIISNEYVVTNRHVVECGSDVQLKLLLSQEIFDVDGIFLHPQQDLAILRVSKLNGRDNALQLSKIAVKTSNQVYVLGNPKGIEGYFTKGNVRRITNDNSFYFDAIIAPGSSGSPVLDAAGNVVGVETVKVTLAGGITFGGAIAISEIINFLPSVQKGAVANVRESKPKRTDDDGDIGRRQPPTSTPKATETPSVYNRGVIAVVPDASSYNPEPTTKDLLVTAGFELKYDPRAAIDTAQKILSQLPADAARREPTAATAHGIVVEGLIQLNQPEQAVQHLLQTWKSGDYVLIRVKQIRRKRTPAQNDTDGWKDMVDGEIITGRNSIVYNQEKLQINSNFPDQSFNIKNTDVEKSQYNPNSKELSLTIKSRNESGKEGKKDYHFYPTGARWTDKAAAIIGVGLFKQVDCGKCSNIFSVLAKASNEYLAQDKPIR